MTKLILQEVIESKILLIRGKKVMVDRDLAELYRVETKYLNRQVRRNIARFPNDFMFRLSVKEKRELVTKCHRFNRLKHSTSLPHAFTEHGALMLANVIKSSTAINMSIAIVRAFIRLREIAITYKEFVYKLSELERKIEEHDTEIQAIFEAIRQLMAPPPMKPKPRIGFRP